MGAAADAQQRPAESSVASFTSGSMLLSTRNALIATLATSVAIILYFRPTWAQKEGRTRWERVAGVAGAATALCWFLIRRWA